MRYHPYGKGMYQVRVHGRRGQATLGTARILAAAATMDGWHAWVASGVEPVHAGSPTVAYVGLHHEDGQRTAATQYDAVIVQDPTLLYETDVLARLRPCGLALLNGESTWQQFGLADRVAHLAPARVLAVPAARLVPGHVWPGGVNAALLGAFAAASGLVSPAAVAAAISASVVARAAADHVVAARRAHDHVLDQLDRLALAVPA